MSLSGGHAPLFATAPAPNLRQVTRHVRSCRDDAAAVVSPSTSANLCLLCTHHHSTVHHDGWNIEMIGGMPWFIPPAWIDSTRTPRQHSRYKITQLRT
jgi:hypothetical protein